MNWIRIRSLDQLDPGSQLTWVCPWRKSHLILNSGFPSFNRVKVSWISQGSCEDETRKFTQVSARCLVYRNSELLSGHRKHTQVTGYTWATVRTTGDLMTHIGQIKGWALGQCCHNRGPCLVLTGPSLSLAWVLSAQEPCSHSLASFLGWWDLKSWLWQGGTCFDIHIHCEMMTTIKLTYVFITWYSYHFLTCGENT